MKLYPIETGNFKLDGGAMFGVVPKTIWNKTNPADENNLIDIAARCLLIEDGKRLILIDTGMGSKQSEKFFGYYSLWGTHSMDKSLAQYGFHRDDITDVFMTHLHFDHCGGSVQWNKDKTGYEPPQKKWMEYYEVQQAIREAKNLLADKGILDRSEVHKKLQPHDAYVADSWDWKCWSASFLFRQD